MAEGKSSRIKDWAALIAALPGLILAVVTAYSTYVEGPQQQARQDAKAVKTYSVVSPEVIENRNLIRSLSLRIISLQNQLDRIVPKAKPEPRSTRASRPLAMEHMLDFMEGGFEGAESEEEAIFEDGHDEAIMIPPSELPSEIPEPTDEEIERVLK